MASTVMVARPVEFDEYGVPLYPAGVMAPAGTYLREDRPWAPALVLDRPEVLPASLDGHRVRYLRCNCPGPG
jgi:hypothetical protein